MVFKTAYSLAQEMLRDAGHRADPLSNVELGKLHQVDKSRGGVGGVGDVVNLTWPMQTLHMTKQWQSTSNLTLLCIF